MAKVAGAEMVVNALPVGRDGGASSGVISNGAVADEVIRDDAVHDGEPPLKVLGKKVMYQEQGGADFAVTQVALEDVATGNHFAVHYASVKGARPGAVCVAERDGRVLLARHWRVSTESWEWEFPRGMGEPGETPEQTALREFHEGTGLHADADSAAVLQRMHADTGVMKDSIAVVGLNVSEVTPDAGHDWELSHLTWCSVQTMDQMIAAGSIADSITLAAYTIWRLRGRA